MEKGLSNGVGCASGAASNLDAPTLSEAEIKKEEGPQEQKATPTAVPGADGDNDDDDPVIHEIPVFLAKSLARQLFLLQYPVRPCRMSYDTSAVVSSRLKPKQQKVELTMALDTGCPNFDASKAEQVALNVDGCGEGEGVDEPTFPSKLMDRVRLTSTRSVKDSSRYAVGVLDANEFHVTPLASIVALRPSFDYLDKSDRTAKAEGRGLADDGEEEAAEAEREKEEADGPKAVTVRFARGSKAEQERRARDQRQKEREEPWLPMRFNHFKSEAWKEESQRMFCSRMDDEVKRLDVNSEQYLNDLVG